MPNWLRKGIGFTLLCSTVGAQALSVGSGGQASYGVPLSVPPGVSGMSPNLALSYADGGINGPVGVGWSVQGISTITRCPSSKVIDGSPLDGNKRPTVRFDKHDRLCLDGQRLIVTNQAGEALPDGVVDASSITTGPYREYRTEKDSFARVRAYGEAVPGNAEAGPAYFRVWTKSGQIYEYGRAPNGAPNALITAQGIAHAAVWAVSRISDTLGNYMDFSYEFRKDIPWGSGSSTAGSLGQEWNIKEVRYTGRVGAGGGTALAPQNKVVFEYDERPDNRDLYGYRQADRSEAYQRGSKNLSIQRLRAVRTYINAAAT
jgi:Salmonella virulence plasmid 65kDa B protein